MNASRTAVLALIPLPLLFTCRTDKGPTVADKRAYADNMANDALQDL